MSKDKNLELWEQVERTKPSQTKNVKSGGRTITAIDAYSQIKHATEMFGKYGDKWGLKQLNHEYITIPVEGKNATLLATLECVFYYPGGEFEIGSSLEMAYTTNKGYYTIDGDYRKKIETDVITKSLSRLGFNSDVFMGLFDDNRYVQAAKAEEQAQAQKKESNKRDKLIKDLEALLKSKQVTEIEAGQYRAWIQRSPTEQQITEQIAKVKGIIEERQKEELHAAHNQ